MKLSSIISVVLVVFFFVSCGSEKSNIKDDESVADENQTVDTNEVSDEDTVTGPECGNSEVEEGENCDGGTKPCTEIDSEKYSTGTAKCKDDCSGFDEEGCVAKAVCGNSVEEEGEECDGGTVECSAVDSKYTSGFAACKDDCSGYDTVDCLPQCGNGILEEGEDCEHPEGEETAETISCHKMSWLEYKAGDAVCGDDCKWDLSACEPLDVVPQYGVISQLGVDTVKGITDAHKLCVPQEGEDKCEFDATFALNHIGDTTFNISGNYKNGSKVILTAPSGFDVITKDSKQACLAVNKGFDPLPEKFFTLFASIAYDRLTFQNIKMYGPQVVLMFNSENIPNTTPGQDDYYNISGIGDDDILVAIGEQMGDGTQDIDVNSLCISAIAFGKTMIVSNAFNVMQDGGGGTITYSGFDIPLYHPTETPLGDLTEMVKGYGLENICEK